MPQLPNPEAKPSLTWFHFIYNFTARMEGYSSNGDNEQRSAEGVLISTISSLKRKGNKSLTKINAKE